MSAVPYKVSRLVSLALAVVFGIVAMSVGINALAKSNDQKDALRNATARLGVTLFINTDDVLKSGIVLTVGSGLLALVSFLSLVAILLSLPFAKRAGSLNIQTALLGFLTVWIFASQVPFTYFFANREAKVTAFAGKFQLPDSAVQATEKQLGATRIYKDIDYLRLSAILPWFAFLFGLTSTILSFLASRRAARSPTHPPSVGQQAIDEKNEARISTEEA
jgi:hypothetical protein